MPSCKRCRKPSCKGACAAGTSSPQPEPIHLVEGAAAIRAKPGTAPMPEGLEPKSAPPTTASTKKDTKSSGKAGTGTEAKGSKATGQASAKPSGTSGARTQSSNASKHSTASLRSGQPPSSTLPLGQGKAPVAGTGASNTQAQGSSSSQKSTASGESGQGASSLPTEKGKAPQLPQTGSGTRTSGANVPGSSDSQKTAASGGSGQGASSLPIGKGKDPNIGPGTQKPATKEGPGAQKPAAEEEPDAPGSEEPVESISVVALEPNGHTIAQLPSELTNDVMEHLKSYGDPEGTGPLRNLSLVCKRFSWIANGRLYAKYKHFTCSLTLLYLRTLLENAQRAGMVRKIEYGDPADRVLRSPPKMRPQDIVPLEEAAKATHSHLKVDWIRRLRLSMHDAYMALVIIRSGKVEVIDLASNRNPGGRYMSHFDLFATDLLRLPGPANAPPQTKHLPKFDFLKTFAVDLLDVERGYDAIQHTLKIPSLETLVIRNLVAKAAVHDSPIKAGASSVKKLILQTCVVDTEALLQMITSFKQLIWFELSTREHQLRQQHGASSLDLTQITKFLEEYHKTTLQTLKLRTWNDGITPIGSLAKFSVLSVVMIQQNMVRDTPPQDLVYYLPLNIRQLWILQGDGSPYDVTDLATDDKKLPSILRELRSGPKYPQLQEINIGWPPAVSAINVNREAQAKAFTQWQKAFEGRRVALRLVETRK